MDKSNQSSISAASTVPREPSLLDRDKYTLQLLEQKLAERENVRKRISALHAELDEIDRSSTDMAKELHTRLDHIEARLPSSGFARQRELFIRMPLSASPCPSCPLPPSCENAGNCLAGKDCPTYGCGDVLHAVQTQVLRLKSASAALYDLHQNPALKLDDMRFDMHTMQRKFDKFAERCMKQVRGQHDQWCICCGGKS